MYDPFYWYECELDREYLEQFEEESEEENELNEEVI